MAESELNVAALPPVIGLPRAELAEWCRAHGHAAYRAAQIRGWIFNRRADDFAAMTDLPASLRTDLADSFRLFAARVVEHREAKDRTEKLLLELADGNVVECVLMRERERRTICISTQVGCGMGCVFCASGMLGLTRNLTRTEILEQILRLDRLLPAGERLSNIVVMGIGEPLANLGELLPALQAIEQPDTWDFGARRITISTVGLPDRIRELAESGHPYHLAVSLHAPNDELRNKLVRVNRQIGVTAILDAADEFFAKTGRRLTFEYVLLGGLNDAAEHARELAQRLRGRHAHVNLIPLNAVRELGFEAPTQENLAAFVATLERSGIAVTVRKRKGADIDAACGQLRLQHERPAGAQGAVVELPVVRE